MQKSSIYLNRELSWLKFNERVLEEASSISNPIFERLRYASIFSNNLNEFYMVRVGGLRDQELMSEIQVDNRLGITATQQLQYVFEQTAKLLPKRDKTFLKIASDMKKIGITKVDLESLSDKDEHIIWEHFEEEIAPIISPQIIDKRHPFPFLDNLKLYVGVKLYSKGTSFRFGIIPVSEKFERVVRIPGKNFKYCLCEEIVAKYASTVFKNYKVEETAVFSVTRNADISVEEGMFDGDIDYRDAMRMLVKARKKLCPVRLEIMGNVSHEFKRYLQKKLDLKSTQVFTGTTPIDMGFVSKLEKKAAPIPETAFFKKVFPLPCPYIDNDKPITPQVLDHDIFLSYPFENMDNYIQLLNEAAVDPDVVSIKITLYRVATNSKVISALIRAREEGKEVFAVVELRARFDEQNNINWTVHLEEAGVNLSYGLEELKTHSKITLITRKTDAGISYITQIGTGNYNEKTSRQYTDVCVMTAHKEIGEDAVRFFSNIALSQTTGDSKHLLIAPETFRAGLITCIEEQIQRAKNGEEAYVAMKANAVTDVPLMNKLIEASCAGVKVDLIIRGICCFKPEVPGFSENIRVISIVGRFLEHSRIYAFGKGDDAKVYIASGDMMTRSTQRRVEIAAPIFDLNIKSRIMKMLEIMLNDNVKSRQCNKNGIYKHVKNENPPLDSQMFFANNSDF